MDIQLKRGLLEVCVLAAIKSEDSYGYKIIKDMKPYIELSESTLYTILKRLETLNMLTVKTAEHDGRLRKYYHITKNGLNRIEEFTRPLLRQGMKAIIVTGIIHQADSDSLPKFYNLVVTDETSEAVSCPIYGKSKTGYSGTGEAARVFDG